MKRKNLVKKIGIVVTTLTLGATKIVFADPVTALSTAKTNLENQIKPIINTVVVPILDLVLVAVLVVVIAKTVMEYKKGREIELAGIVLLVAGIILVSTFPTWGWQLIG